MWLADHKIQLQNLQLVSFAWNICSVGAQECLEKVELVVAGAKLIGRYKMDTSFWAEK